LIRRQLLPLLDRHLGLEMRRTVICLTPSGGSLDTTSSAYDSQRSCS
jgi:hypothetical protein